MFGLLLLIAAVTSVCRAQDAPTTAPSPTKKKNKGMEGRIKIAGNIFQVSCDCSEHALQNAASHVESVKRCIQSSF